MKKRRVLKKGVISVIKTTISFSFIIFALILITVNLNEDSTPKPLMNITEVGNANYTVALLPNNYFEQTELSSNQQYISSIIDQIKSNFTYNFTSDKNFNYVYKYRVIGTLTANHKIDTDTSKTVLTKQYALVQPTTVKKTNSNHFKIDKKVNIDYGKFNAYINEFKKDYVLTVTANLNVKLIVNVTGTLNGYDNPIKTTYQSSIDIPLSEQTINIAINNKKPNVTTSIVDKNKNIIKNVPYFILGILILIISLLVLITTILSVFKAEEKDKKYQKKLKKILSNYDEVIVQTKNKINLKDMQVIYVESFEELMDAQQELRIPIAYTEIYKNEEDMFVLIHGKEAWVYVFRNTHD